MKKRKPTNPNPFLKRIKNATERKKDHKDREKFRKPYEKVEGKRKPLRKKQESVGASDGQVRLNKYIANAGVCSRRDADKLIESGVIKVNGKIVTTLGIKVNPGDVVDYGGERLNTEKKIYLLLNKPKGFITTLDDPGERKTVMLLEFRMPAVKGSFPWEDSTETPPACCFLPTTETLPKNLPIPGTGSRKFTT